MKEVKSNPLSGARHLTTTVMSDQARNLMAEDGWIKMARNVNGVEIHFVYNTITKVVTDFKFKIN